MSPIWFKRNSFENRIVDRISQHIEPWSLNWLKRQKFALTFGLALGSISHISISRYLNEIAAHASVAVLTFGAVIRHKYHNEGLRQPLLTELDEIGNRSSALAKQSESEQALQNTGILRFSQNDENQDNQSCLLAPARAGSRSRHRI